MLSLEPWTVGRLVYSRGTTEAQRLFASTTPASASRSADRLSSSRPAKAIRAPLVNYQHPHDLLMGLGATYRIDRGRVTYVFGADLVGSPALGPTAVHAPRIGAQQPAGAAHASLPRLDAHHPGCAPRRRRDRPDHVRGLGVSRRRAGRKPAEHRAAARSIPGRRASAGVAARGRRRCPAAVCTSRNGSIRTTSPG